MAKAKRLPSGNWRVNLYIGKSADGKRQYKSFTDPDRKAAEYMAAEYALTKHEGTKPIAMTVGEAIDRFIDTKTNVLSPSTIATYKKIRKNNLKSLMAISLDTLTQDQIQIAINIESASHTPKTVRNQHGLLAAALAAYHPSFQLRTKLPQKVKPNISVPDQSMINALMVDVKSKPLELPIVLAACMGLRRSEISALTWTDYNAKLKTLSITKAMVKNDENLWVIKAPKTYSGSRILSIPDAVIPLLTQGEPSERIAPMNPAQITESFFRVKQRLGLPIRFHDLRHYYASILLSIGIPDKYAMERMGHATPNMLKTVYQHTLRDKQQGITDQVNAEINRIMQHEMQHEVDKPQ